MKVVVPVIHSNNVSFSFTKIQDFKIDQICYFEYKASKRAKKTNTILLLVRDKTRLFVVNQGLTWNQTELYVTERMLINGDLSEISKMNLLLLLRAFYFCVVCYNDSVLT